MKVIPLLPESIVRPLGHGYFPIGEQSGGSSSAADFAAGLERISSDDNVTRHLRTLGPSPVCLMEGISSPRNGGDLRRFLAEHGLCGARVTAVDLADMGSIFDMIGQPLEGVDFQVADASALDGVGAGSVDLLVQDSLLNSAPHCLHDAILKEAARVLRPGGLALISFTDHRGLANRFRVRHPRPGAPAYGLRDLPPALREGLFQNAVLLEPDPQRLTLVTPPHGNFEFYFPCSYVSALFERHSLEPLVHLQWRGGDRYGSDCHRHVTMARRMPGR